jgi:hypothetical protein
MAIKRSSAYSLISALVITSAVSVGVMSCGGDDSKKETPATNTTKVKYSEISSFVGTSCATSGCHSATSPADGYNMSTRAGIAARSSDAVKAIENGSMPIGAQKTTFDADATNKAKLIEWLKAGAPE